MDERVEARLVLRLFLLGSILGACGHSDGPARGSARMVPGPVASDSVHPSSPAPAPAPAPLLEPAAAQEAPNGELEEVVIETVANVPYAILSAVVSRDEGRARSLGRVNDVFYFERAAPHPAPAGRSILLTGERSCRGRLGLSMLLGRSDDQAPAPEPVGWRPAAPVLGCRGRGYYTGILDPPSGLAPAIELETPDEAAAEAIAATRRRMEANAAFLDRRREARGCADRGVSQLSRQWRIGLNRYVEVALWFAGEARCQPHLAHAATLRTADGESKPARAVSVDAWVEDPTAGEYDDQQYQFLRDLNADGVPEVAFVGNWQSGGFTLHVVPLDPPLGSGLVGGAAGPVAFTWQPRWDTPWGERFRQQADAHPNLAAKRAR